MLWRCRAERRSWRAASSGVETRACQTLPRRSSTHRATSARSAAAMTRWSSSLTIAGLRRDLAGRNVLEPQLAGDDVADGVHDDIRLVVLDVVTRVVDLDECAVRRLGS